MAKTTCEDNNCPHHHSLRTHGRTFTGTVTEAKSAKTVTVQWQRKHYLPKFERYENKITRIHAHSPACIEAKKGDIVKLMECRPLSKTKHFVITEKLGADYAFLAREELLLQAVVPEKEKKEEKKDEQSAENKDKEEQEEVQ